MTLKERVKALANERGISLPALEAELGFGNSTIVKWDKSTPNAEKLYLVAKYFNVSMDYLLTGKMDYERNESSIKFKNELDIGKILDEILTILKNSQNNFLFFDDPIGVDTKEILKLSLENCIKITNINASQSRYIHKLSLLSTDRISIKSKEDDIQSPSEQQTLADFYKHKHPPLSTERISIKSKEDDIQSPSEQQTLADFYKHKHPPLSTERINIKSTGNDDKETPSDI